MERLLGKFFVKDGKPHDWECSEDDVVALVDEGLIQGLAAEG